jgi:endonuclease-3 related protein
VRIEIIKYIHNTYSEKSDTKHVVRVIYDHLFDSYGPQGWWPLIDLHETSCATHPKTKYTQGYHPGNYTYPQTSDQRFEIISGALLTQNTSWIQVEKALLNLKQLDALSPEIIISLNSEALIEAIKPAGYYNQKAIRLKNLAIWFQELKYRIPTREELLSLKGIGPETADSILLYAFNQPLFVIDAYTRRIVTNLRLASEKANYDELKALFEENLPHNPVIYQEYHALMVEHAKRYYLKKSSCTTKCPLLKIVLD